MQRKSHDVVLCLIFKFLFGFWDFITFILVAYDGTCKCWNCPPLLCTCWCCSSDSKTLYQWCWSSAREKYPASTWYSWLTHGYSCMKLAVLLHSYLTNLNILQPSVSTCMWVVHQSISVGIPTAVDSRQIVSKSSEPGRRIPSQTGRRHRSRISKWGTNFTSIVLLCLQTGSVIIHVSVHMYLISGICRWSTDPLWLIE